MTLTLIFKSDTVIAQFRFGNCTVTICVTRGTKKTFWPFAGVRQYRPNLTHGIILLMPNRCQNVRTKKFRRIIIRISVNFNSDRQQTVQKNLDYRQMYPKKGSVSHSFISSKFSKSRLSVANYDHTCDLAYFSRSQVGLRPWGAGCSYSNEQDSFVIVQDSTDQLILF